MSTITCARCAWRPNPDSDVPAREQAQVHAADLGHPRCVCCGQSLVRGELGTCETRDPGDGTPCLQTAREHLSGIRALYDQLGSHLGHLRGPRLDSSSPSASDGRPLPGGNVLALLGPGSRGDSEDGHTTKDGDPVSVAYELTWWAEDWAARFGDQATDVRPRTPAAQMRQALAYIERKMRHASREHPAFDAFAGDLRTLHRTLERASALIRTPARPAAACFDCGGQLIVGLVEATVAQVVTPHQWWLPGRIGPLPPPPLASWTGLVEQDPPHIQCERCHRGYTPAAYALARRQLLERERERERERQAAQAAFKASG